MYVYQIEIYEPYCPSNTIELVQSEFEYEQEEFETLIKSFKNQTIEENGHMAYSYFMELLKKNGFDIFDFKATAYLT